MGKVGYCQLLLYAMALSGVSAAPKDAGVELGLEGDAWNENTTRVLGLIQSFSIPVAVVLLVLPFLMIAIVCCKSRRRRNELDGEKYKDLELKETKWADLPEKIDDSADDSDKCLSDSEDKKAYLDKTATSFRSVLFVTLPPPPTPPPPPSNGHLERERSLRRSFKLPVLPPEAHQQKVPGLGQAIPVPKLVEAYRQNCSPIKPLADGEIRLSPFMHRRSPVATNPFTQSESLSDRRTNFSLSHKHSIEPVRSVDNKMERFWEKLKTERYESKTLPGHMMTRKESCPPYFPNTESPSHNNGEILVHNASRTGFRKDYSESGDLSKPMLRPDILHHAKSLDERLDFSGTGKVTVDLDPTKKSKYSRVTITASLEMLNENMLDPKERSCPSLDYCEELPNEPGKCSPDATSVVSYTLTNDMVDSKEYSSISSLEACEDRHFSSQAGSYSSLAVDEEQINDCSTQLEEAEVEEAGNEGGGNDEDGNEGDGNEEDENEGVGNEGVGNEGVGNDEDGNEGDRNEEDEDEGVGNEGVGNEGVKNEGVGNEGVGNEGVGNEGVGNEGVGNEGVGNEGVGNEGVGNEGVGNEGVGIEGVENEKDRNEEDKKDNKTVEEVDVLSVDGVNVFEKEVAFDSECEEDQKKLAEVGECCSFSESLVDITEEGEGMKVIKENYVEREEEKEEVILSDAEEEMEEGKEDGIMIEEGYVTSMPWDDIKLTEVRIQGEDDVVNEENYSGRVEGDDMVDEEDYCGQVEVELEEEESETEVEKVSVVANLDNSNHMLSDMRPEECPADKEEIEDSCNENDADSALSEQGLGDLKSELEHIVDAERIEGGRLCGMKSKEVEIAADSEALDESEGSSMTSETSGNKPADLNGVDWINEDIPEEKKDREINLVITNKMRMPETEMPENVMGNADDSNTDAELSIMPAAAIGEVSENEVEEDVLDGNSSETEEFEGEKKEDYMQTEVVEESTDILMETTDSPEVDSNSPLRHGSDSAEETEVEIASETATLEHKSSSLESLGIKYDATNTQQEMESTKDTEVCTVIVKFEPEGAMENWPTALIEDDPVPIQSDGTPSICSKQDTGRGNVVEDDKKKSQQVEEGVSSASIEDLKLLYTACQNTGDRMSIAPIPTPPPSPPKGTTGATSDLESSQSLNFSTPRPSSTLSLPFTGHFSTSPILTRSLPAPPHPASLPSSPTVRIPRSTCTAPEGAARRFKESSPRPYFSSDSGTDEDEDNILRQSRLRRPIKHRKRSTQPGISKAGAGMPSAFLSPDSSPLHHSFKSDSEGKTNREEDSSRKRNSDDMRPTCLGCGDYLPFILKGEPTKTGGRSDNVPIYYVLERPTKCQSCLQGNTLDSSPERRRNSKASMTSLPPSLPPRDSPPLPPLPTPPAFPSLPYQSKNDFSSAAVEDPVYETVLSTRQKEQDKGQETGSRNMPLEFTRKSREFHTSSDYESISSFESSVRSEKDDQRRSFRRGQSNRFGTVDSFEASYHDYETISLDYTHKSEDAKSDGVSKLHSYARIPVKDRIEEADSPMEVRGPISASANDKRNKLMKIDSHGYASVLPPGAQDNFWEQPDSNQQSASSDQPSPQSSSRHRVNNTEEAWKHQLERGYAPLTLKTQSQTGSATLLNRTSSDGILANSLSLVAPGSTPRDYEVPIPRHPPPPPLSLAKRKSSSPLTRQNPVFSPTSEHQTFLCDITEKDTDFCPVSIEGDSDELKIMHNGTNFLTPGNGHRNRKLSASDISGLAPTSIPLPYNSQ